MVGSTLKSPFRMKYVLLRGRPIAAWPHIAEFHQGMDLMLKVQIYSHVGMYNEVLKSFPILFIGIELFSLYYSIGCVGLYYYLRGP